MSETQHLKISAAKIGDSALGGKCQNRRTSHTSDVPSIALAIAALMVLGAPVPSEAAVTHKYLFELRTDEAHGGPLNQPADVSIDASGDIYVADTVNSRIVVFDDAGRAKAVFGKNISHDVGLNQPMALTVDSGNKMLYVADSLNYKVQVFKTDGQFVSSIDLNRGLEEGAKKVRPIGIAVSTNTNIYVSDADNNYIRVYSAAGKPLFKFGGFGPEDGKLCVPVGLFLGAGGELYVVDMNNSRLEVFDRKGNFLSKIGSAGDTKGSFFKPKDVCVDEKGFVFISDGGNGVVQVFDPSGKFADVIGAEEDPQLQLGYPAGVAAAKGRLYIADRARNSIRVYEIKERDHSQ